MIQSGKVSVLEIVVVVTDHESHPQQLRPYGTVVNNPTVIIYNV